MNLLNTLILSTVEGISEFLPISSTGHLILASHLLALRQTEFLKSFEIAIQSGAILSVVVLYGRKLLSDQIMLKKTLVAFLPTAVIGFILYKLIKTFLLGNEAVTIAALFLGGIALIGLELFFIPRETRAEERRDHGKEHKETIDTISYRKAALIGVFQSISVIPGVSRSAATIIGGLFLGMTRYEATEFSFVLAIPTMFAATSLDLLKSSSTFTVNQIQTLIIGFLASFIVALVAVKWFIGYVRYHNFIPFGVYRIVLAILYFFLFFR